MPDLGSENPGLKQNMHKTAFIMLVQTVEGSVDISWNVGAYPIEVDELPFSMPEMVRSLTCSIVTVQMYIEKYSHYPLRNWPYYGFSGRTDWSYDKDGMKE